MFTFHENIKHKIIQLLKFSSVKKFYFACKELLMHANGLLLKHKATGRLEFRL